MKSGLATTPQQSPRFTSSGLACLGGARTGPNPDARHAVDETLFRHSAPADLDTRGSTAPEAPSCPYCGAGRGEPCFSDCAEGGWA